MQYAVKDLDGQLLNAAVAKAEGLPTHPGRDRYVVATPIDHRWADQFNFLSWTHGGPLVEREKILLAPLEHGGWRAVHLPSGEDGPQEPVAQVVDEDGEEHILTAESPTIAEEAKYPLVAAMRAFCASRFGETVELP